MKFLVFALLSAFVASTHALSCSQQCECSSVTTNYNYVQCVSGQCQCLSSKGFTCAATPANKCSCLSPNNVYWEGGSPYCVNFNNAVQAQAQKSRCDILKAKAATLYNSLIW